MIYEWYSGSDKKGRVATGVRKFSEMSDDVDLSTRISFLEKLLRIEKDPNWRGYLMHYLGVQYLDSRKVEQGVAALKVALGEFDTLAANFRDVAGEYGRTLFYVLRELWGVVEVEEIYEYILRTLPYLNDMDLDRENMSQFTAFAADAILQLAQKGNDPCLYRAATEFGMQVHHLDPDDPYVLEDLVYACVGAGDIRSAKLAYQQIKGLKADFEYRGRLDEFCEKAFSGRYVVDEDGPAT